MDKQKFILRKWKSGDAQAIVKHANNKNIAKFLRDSFPSPYTFVDASHWIQYANCGVNGVQLAIVVNEEVIGCVGVEIKDDVYRKSAELGYWLGEDYWNKGIMTKAVKQMVEYAFLNLNIVRLFAYVFEGNNASCRVLEKAGFILESIQKMAIYKNGKLKDQLIYAMVRLEEVK
ncbi:GNAT family N-acetyltransferase [Ancylomarina longa]|uniref:GNAT family N-acetyltransferase n=1 Tax=Ancylomarina longa TaxID=2487017 RepID=UPI001ADEA85F|nr:GNAT family protein [Ancylomarina longa]